MSGLTAGELREALTAGLAQRLAPEGWSEVDAGSFGSDMGVRLVALARPVAEDFVATVEVCQGRSLPDTPPVLVTHMFGGVGYEPLRRLAPLLGIFDLAVMSALLWPESLASDDEVEDEEEDQEEHRREVRTRREAEQLAGELAAVVRARAVPYAEHYADLELLLTTVPGPRSSIDRAALLASAGRFDEATALLAQLAPPAPGLNWMRDQQRATRQLQRWIQSGGDPGLIPDQPPPHRESPATPSVAEVWQSSRATTAAVNAVKRDGKGKDRVELREMLQRELALRDVNQSPLWFERTLDHLHDTPAQSSERLVKGLISAGKLGIKVVRAIRDERPLLDQLPDLSLPGWLDPPARAAWEVPRSTRENWAEVRLDPQSREWLDRVYQAIPRLVGSAATMQAWLDWDSNEHQRLAVHIGERQVGTLDQTATTAYRAQMHAAGQRDESPHTRARLTPRPSPEGYLLEIQLPG